MRVVLLSLTLFSQFAVANLWVAAEMSSVWQTRNDVGIPSIGGTRFSLKDLSTGPFTAARFYAGYDFGKRHRVRLLYAPFLVTADGTYNEDIQFDGGTFTKRTPLTATYQFNSYRFTYDYLFYLNGSTKLAIGFTAKIRDAKIALQQGSNYKENKNIGFVPLLHFSALTGLGKRWSLLFDIDGLAAPQGRAFDATLQLRFHLTKWCELYGGYRTLEGGAENDTVFTFAWLHYLLAGTRINF